MARKKKSETDADYESVEEAEAAEDAEADYEITSFAGDRVEVEITADHIYLPLDAEGNVPANWRASSATVRVEKGTKLTMPADLLEGLAGKVEASS